MRNESSGVSSNAIKHFLPLSYIPFSPRMQYYQTFSKPVKQTPISSHSQLIGSSYPRPWDGKSEQRSFSCQPSPRSQGMSSFRSLYLRFGCGQCIPQAFAKSPTGGVSDRKREIDGRYQIRFCLFGLFLSVLST
jgi:hypothetical protein